MRKLNLGMMFAAALASAIASSRPYVDPLASYYRKRSALDARGRRMPAGTKMLREAKAGMIGKRNGRKL